MFSGMTRAIQVRVNLAGHDLNGRSPPFSIKTQTSQKAIDHLIGDLKAPSKHDPPLPCVGVSVLLAWRRGTNSHDFEAQPGQVVKESGPTKAEEVEHCQIAEFHSRQQRYQPDMKWPIRDADIEQATWLEYPPRFLKSPERVSQMVQHIDEGHHIGRLICKGARGP